MFRPWCTGSRADVGRTVRKRVSLSRRKRRPIRPAVERLEDRLAPATVSWNVDASGFWDVASNWIDDQGVSRLPAAGDDVIIDRPAGAFTVTHRSGTDTVASITSTESLTLTGGILQPAGTVQVSGAFSLSTGTLRGGTVAAGTTLVAGSSVGVLDGVTLAGDMTAPVNGGASVTNGL